jgi:hypothetical protein
LNLGLSEQLLAISQFNRTIIILFFLVSGVCRADSLTSFVVKRSEKFEIDSLVGSWGTFFLARDEDLVNLLSLFPLLNHLPQDFFQHSIFGRLLDDAMLRVNLARTEVDRSSVHPRCGMAHFR